MKKLSFRFVVAFMLLLAPTVTFAAPSPQAKQEIQQLMDSLSDSQCEFQRNGTWHGRAEARRHLQRKYDYLLKKDLVDTAEQFIERAASASSLSGRAYQVRCPGQPVQPAGDWFRRRLDALRGSGTPAR
ncbi:DUF5329 domain-containing protein [Pseudoxanthomonas putridarboris]|uniref:DUF5329 domain-containing protein n=1 Tax=Pseudoxanthomonas putridarboris TaxID=752605 RepID=A0ABU9IYS6_9GAMM